MLGDRVHYWMALREAGTYGIHNFMRGCPNDSVGRPRMATFQIARTKVARARETHFICERAWCQGRQEKHVKKCQIIPKVKSSIAQTKTTIPI